MTTTDPVWFFQATFDGGGTATFYADSKALAFDHAGTLARDFGKRGVRTVTRLKHRKDVTPTENAQAGALYE
jgi:hypothetical protein